MGSSFLEHPIDFMDAAGTRAQAGVHLYGSRGPTLGAMVKATALSTDLPLHHCLDNHLTTFHGVILLRTMKFGFHDHCLFSRPLLALHVFSRFRPVFHGHSCVFHGLFTLFHGHSACCCSFTAIAFFHGHLPKRPTTPGNIAKWFSRWHDLRCNHNEH